MLGRWDAVNRSAGICLFDREVLIWLKQRTSGEGAGRKQKGKEK